MPLLLEPFTKPAIKSITVPGSKSITNRIFPLAILAETEVTIHGALESEDGEIMRKVLSECGAKITEGEKLNSYHISAGTYFEDASFQELFCGNSGTTLRFITALSALRKGKTTLTGIDRMKERPIGDLGNALEQVGINIEYNENTNFPPITIGTKKIENDENKKLLDVTLSGSLSSQFFTALFHIAPKIGMSIQVENELVSKPYIDMTIALMSQFGIEVENKNYEQFIIPKQKFSAPKEIIVEGDASSATYPLAIGLITGGEICIENIPENSLQGDAQFKNLVIDKMRDNSNKNTLLPLGEINLEDIPDAAMTAVTLCAYADGYSKITGLSTLRHKECDRLYALELNLKKMGIQTKTGEDYIEIWGNSKNIHGADIECFNDHRVAMAFAVLGAKIEGVNILDPKCSEKTYPTFWEDFESWKI